MKIVSQPNVIIYILSENLNTVTKCHLCAVFNTIIYIVSNYVIILLVIDVKKFF